MDEDRREQAAMFGEHDCGAPRFGAQPDAEHEANSPVVDDAAPVLVDHEDRSIGVRLLAERGRDLVVAVEDRPDDTLLGATLAHPWPLSAEGQRHPFVGMHEAWGDDE